MSPVLVAVPRAPKKRQPPVSVRIPEKLLARIEEAAARLKLKRSEAILQLVEFALDEHEKEQAKKSKK